MNSVLSSRKKPSMWRVSRYRLRRLDSWSVDTIRRVKLFYGQALEVANRLQDIKALLLPDPADPHGNPGLAAYMCEALYHFHFTRFHARRGRKRDKERSAKSLECFKCVDIAGKTWHILWKRCELLPWLRLVLLDQVDKVSYECLRLNLSAACKVILANDWELCLQTTAQCLETYVDASELIDNVLEACQAEWDRMSDNDGVPCGDDEDTEDLFDIGDLEGGLDACRMRGCGRLMGHER
jgi:hypothetical protein